MKKVQANELLDLGAYEEIRERFRARIMAMKADRRLAIGDHMTMIWENHDTMLYQIQEMLRTERISAKPAIQHELDTYNSLVPESGQLSGTLMIEYTDAEERSRALSFLASLRNEMSMRIGDRRVPAVFHDQPGEEAGRLPAVNYVTINVGDVADAFDDASVEVVVEVANADYVAKGSLPAAMRKQLAEDLRG
jgi:hypothetical protein